MEGIRDRSGTVAGIRCIIICCWLKPLGIDLCVKFDEIRENTVVDTTTNDDPLNVLVIDQTQNVKGFEYRTSRRIIEDMKANKINLSCIDVVMVANPTELEHALSNHDFSAVLLFAHGGPSSTTGNADLICFGDKDIPWQQLQMYFEPLEAKLLVLCVCEGINIDSVWSTVNGIYKIGMLVGPNDKISPKEAKAFFPEFFTELKSRINGKITHDQVFNSVEHANRVAKIDKMVAK